MTKNLKILLLVLIIILLGAYITFYYISLPKSPSPLANPNELTQIQRDAAITELKQVVSKSPSLTNKQRAQAIEELRKTITK